MESNKHGMQNVILSFAIRSINELQSRLSRIRYDDAYSQALNSSISSFVFWEESISQTWELLLKHQVKSIFECVGADNSSLVSEQNNSSAACSIRISKMYVFDDREFAIIFVSCLLHHEVFELAFAFIANSLDKVDLFLSAHELYFLLEQLDHTLLNIHSQRQSVKI